MSIIDNVERAFPIEYDHGQGGTAVQFGMSLRDYFAAKAMGGRAAIPGAVDPGYDAALAYQLADAMIAERAK